MPILCLLLFVVIIAVSVIFLLNAGPGGDMEPHEVLVGIMIVLFVFVPCFVMLCVYAPID